MLPSALITGASRGLGLALAKAMAKKGWSLLLTARDDEKLRHAVEECTQAGAPIALSLPGDLNDPHHHQALAQLASKALGHIDVLIHNAAALGDPKLPPLLQVPLTQLESLLRTNLFAPLGLTQACANLLPPQACIVYVSSDAAKAAYPGWGAYGLSKAALEHAAATIALEQAHWHVHWVDPGEMRTDMYAEHMPGDLSHLPLPEEVAVPHLLRLIESQAPSGFSEARPEPQEG